MQERQRFGRSLHRASYLLERGIWRATCQECGFQVSDEYRRQAASQFRLHIQAHREEPDAHREPGIDLRQPVDTPQRATPYPGPVDRVSDGGRALTSRSPRHKPADMSAGQTGAR